MNVVSRRQFVEGHISAIVEAEKYVPNGKWARSGDRDEKVHPPHLPCESEC
jgi:hypothetical protein